MLSDKEITGHMGKDQVYLISPKVWYLGLI